MILSDIKHYLSQRGSASLSDLCIHFDTKPEAMRGMLEQWIRKGRVQKQSASASCGSSCSKCDLETTEFYQWVDAATGSFKGIAIKPEHCDK